MGMCQSTALLLVSLNQPPPQKWGLKKMNPSSEDSVTYTTAMIAFEKGGQWQKALLLFEEAVTRTRCDLVIYNAPTQNRRALAQTVCVFWLGYPVWVGLKGS